VSAIIILCPEHTGLITRRIRSGSCFAIQMHPPGSQFVFIRPRALNLLEKLTKLRRSDSNRVPAGSSRICFMRVGNERSRYNRNYISFPTRPIRDPSFFPSSWWEFLTAGRWNINVWFLKEERPDVSKYRHVPKPNLNWCIINVGFVGAFAT
jgi:hypothetical protein